MIVKKDILALILPVFTEHVHLNATKRQCDFLQSCKVFKL